MKPPTQPSSSNNIPATFDNEQHANSTSSQAATVASEVASGIEQLSYTDCSRITMKDVQREEGSLPETFASPSSPWGREPPFPLKLHRILSDEKHGSAVAWLSHGRAWRIVDSRALEREALSDHFKHGRLASFMRQVNIWGFRRVKSGRDEGAYYHECFLRGLPHVCLKMRRLTGKRPTFGRLYACPDLYAMSEQHPVPDEDGTLPDAASAKPDSEQQSQTAAAPAPNSSSPGPEQKYQSTCASGSVHVSSENPTNAMDFQQCTSMGFGGAGTVSNTRNADLPLYLLSAAQRPAGWLPSNLLQRPSNQTQDLNRSVQCVNNLYGQQVGASLLHHQALSQGGLNMDLTALNLQLLQQLIAQRPIGTTNNVATRSRAPEQEVPPTQSLELRSALSQLASKRASTVTPSASNSSMAAAATTSAGSTHAREKKVAQKVDSKASSRTTDTVSARHAKATYSPRRAFISPPKFGETSSRSSSPAGPMNESGSESSTENAAQNVAEQEHDSTANRSKEENSKEGCTGGDSTTSSLSSVSMSDEPSDSSSHPTESNDGESTDSKEMPTEAGKGRSLRRHRSSRRTLDQTTSSAATSLLAMSLGQSGSDTSSARQSASSSPSFLGKKSVTMKTKIEQASDRSSASASATNNKCPDDSSLRKLWSLVSSADESNASASHGIVGAAIGDEGSSDGLESDAISAPSSTQSSTDKQKVGFAYGQQATRPAQQSGTPGSALDVAAKAMTLGSPLGTGRAGTADPTATVTNTSCSGYDSMSIMPNSNSSWYDSMSIMDEAESSCSAKVGARTSSPEKEWKTTRPQKKKRERQPVKSCKKQRVSNPGLISSPNEVTQSGSSENPARELALDARVSMARFGESIYKIMSSQADMTPNDLLSSIRDAYEAAEADAK